MAGSAFLKLDGIDGESQAQGYEKYIELSSWNWGGSNSHSMDTAGGRTRGNAVAQPVQVTKPLDASSPELYKRVFSQQKIPTGELAVTILLDNTPKPLLVLTLADIYIGDVGCSGAGDDSGSSMDSILLFFSKVEWAYTKYDGRTGDSQGEISGSFVPSTGEVG